LNAQTKSDSFFVGFASDLLETASIDIAHLRRMLERCSSNPTPGHFWLLAREVRVCDHSVLKPLIDQISKLANPYRSTMLSAAFVVAHLLRAGHSLGHTECYKWCKGIVFPPNVWYSVQLYNIMALPTFANVLPPQFCFLDIDHERIQQIAAAAIARTAKTPSNLLRRILGTISGDPPSDVELLTLSKPRSVSVQLRGLIFVARFLQSNPISVREYLNAFLPILMSTPSDSSERSLCFHAQESLAQLMLHHPTAFHHRSIIDAASHLVQIGAFTPVFLSSILTGLGLYAIRRFVTTLLPRWIEAISDDGFDFVAVIAPYSMYFEIDLQLQLQKALVERCERRRFDIKLFEVTSIVMLTSCPTLSPFLGQFLEAVSRTASPQSILNVLKPLVEPKIAPVLHPMRTSMAISDSVGKSDAFTQANPLLKSMIVQCDRSREISPTVLPRARPALPARPGLAPITPIPMKEMPLPPTLDLPHLDLDLDAPPDSDESSDS
jgi:hypothetical protein